MALWKYESRTSKSKKSLKSIQKTQRNINLKSVVICHATKIHIRFHRNPHKICTQNLSKCEKVKLELQNAPKIIQIGQGSAENESIELCSFWEHPEPRKFQKSSKSMYAAPLRFSFVARGQHLQISTRCNFFRRRRSIAKVYIFEKLRIFSFDWCGRLVSICYGFVSHSEATYL